MNKLAALARNHSTNRFLFKAAMAASAAGRTMTAGAMSGGSTAITLIGGWKQQFWSLASALSAVAADPSFEAALLFALCGLILSLALIRALPIEAIASALTTIE